MSEPTPKEVAAVLGASPESPEPVQLAYAAWVLREMADGLNVAIDRSIYLKPHERAYWLRKAADAVDEQYKRSLA